jgi:hypothetical protein
VIASEVRSQVWLPRNMWDGEEPIFKIDLVSLLERCFG